MSEKTPSLFPEEPEPQSSPSKDDYVDAIKHLQSKVDLTEEERMTLKNLKAGLLQQFPDAQDAAGVTPAESMAKIWGQKGFPPDMNKELEKTADSVPWAQANNAAAEKMRISAIVKDMEGNGKSVADLFAEIDATESQQDRQAAEKKLGDVDRLGLALKEVIKTDPSKAEPYQRLQEILLTESSRRHIDLQ